MINTPTALIVATMDTKGQEAIFLADCLKTEGIAVKIMDAGIRGKCPVTVAVTREEVAQASGKSLPLLAHPPFFSHKIPIKNELNQLFKFVGTGCAFLLREENLRGEPTCSANFTGYMQMRWI